MVLVEDDTEDWMELPEEFRSSTSFYIGLMPFVVMGIAYALDELIENELLGMEAEWQIYDFRPNHNTLTLHLDYYGIDVFEEDCDFPISDWCKANRLKRLPDYPNLLTWISICTRQDSLCIAAL